MAGADMRETVVQIRMGSAQGRSGGAFDLVDTYSFQDILIDSLIA